MKRYRIENDSKTGEQYIPVRKAGPDLLIDPLLNKGTAWPREERVALGIEGLLPPKVSTVEQQLERVYENYSRQPDDLARYLYLVSLQDRNETLFYRLLLEHVEEMTPIVYTPTVGEACQKFSHIYRRARGLYITQEHRASMRDVLRNAPYEGVGVIVATDNEGILGIGDQGAGGMGIPIGKLTLYTLGAGIHPARCLPVCLDVGTGNAALRQDPLYLGVDRPRLRGDAYFEMLDAFVEAVTEVFPDVLLQWEDFSRQTAFSVLDRYRDRVCSFNDDIQGTGAVAFAGVLGVVEATGVPLRDQRFCVYGAGAGGGGVIGVLLAGLRESGLSPSEARERLVAVDSQGVILDGREHLAPYKKTFARQADLVAGWKLEQEGRVSLMDAVRNFEPTVLIGTSGQPGSFTEAIVREMASHVERPAIFAMSNPTSKSELVPADAIAWTNGRALVATGSPFQPVRHEGKVFPIGQGNNAFCFPGIGLGVVASRARQVTDGMLLAAARAVADKVPAATLQAGGLYPSIEILREASLAVARAVGETAITEAVVADESLTAENLAAKLEREMWYPSYLPYRRSS